MKKIVLLFVISSLTVLSCSKEEVSVSETNTTTGETNVTQTEVVLNIVDSKGDLKSGYSVLMFLVKPTENQILPNIEMEMTSDINGNVKFDLDDYITNPKMLYFEAFTKVGEDYVWEGLTHPSKLMTKNIKWSSSIIVK